MNDTSDQGRSVVIEREMAHSPEKIWRALTQPHLIEEWLMKGDFSPVPGHQFAFHAAWGSVQCRVLAVEPNRILTYTWEAMGLESIITWTLRPTGTGTHLRMEQSGFRRDQEQAYQGARLGWTKFLGNLDDVLARPVVEHRPRAN